MPVITIQMAEGRSTEQKRTVARDITKTVANTFGVDPAAIIVLYQELPRENIAKNGELLSDEKR
ncbi:MAG: tautomerase family protein [Methanocalculus sp.]|uniref:tautomerase family protein n=1 Tax=Methanocalculus sp. TaxID=2004547 RepID=UPI00271569F6|nr:tautomerase family protein [Methanocalculus sp.]MDO9538817.1 tautomerase family protein [Methanocalculus sp.]